MVSIRVACIGLEVTLLLYAGCTDIAARMIPNAVCLLLATVGITSQRLLANPRQSASLGLPADAVMHFLTTTVLAGGVLALMCLLLRLLPSLALSAVGSSPVRCVYAIERWRRSRRAPLPYGVAIACSGIWALVGHGV